MNSKARYEGHTEREDILYSKYLYVNLPNLHTQFSFDAIHCNIYSFNMKTH